MNIPTIEQGEELLKKVSDAEWNWDANNPQHQLLAFLVNHASELLQMAREVERMKGIERKCIEWCDTHIKAWEETSQRKDYKGDRAYDHTCFPSGAQSGYHWMKDHIPHLFSGEDCKCP